MSQIEFPDAFAALTDNDPFPWQRALYAEWFSRGKFPDACTLPTGLGKTSVVAVWLIALANHPDRVPRRLVYVVNRRTVVDQTTDEVANYRKRLTTETDKHAVLPGLAAALASLAATPARPPLAISTLRGQFADNREWSADPSRPAVICGTVDMIGSRLLFGGYGVGFKARPLHAGFLGQDALVVHDEAHLEKPFQDLLTAIECEQRGGRLDDKGRCVESGTRRGDFKPLRVMALTATPRGGANVFTLTADEQAGKVERVRMRLEAKKRLRFHPVGSDRGAAAKKIADLAAAHKDADKAVLVFVRTLEDVATVEKELARTKRKVLTLTGTIRGKERDELVDHEVFQRFTKDARPGETVYLVCTSAGEVGVDISADHLACDLTPFDSMAQRFGRVNRYGGGDAHIDVVYEAERDKRKADDPLDRARWKTLELLRQLPAATGQHDASPKALGDLPPEARIAAFTPPPTILPTSDILFDAWALTTIREPLPGRPLVEPYLHGAEDERSYDTEFAWREEVELLTGTVDADVFAEWLDEFRLKPHETLRVSTFGKGRACDQLEAIKKRVPDLPAWVIEPDGEVRTFEHISDLLEKRGNDYVVPLASRTVVLPPRAGGLTAQGTLDGSKEHSDAISYDVAGDPPGEAEPLLRLIVETTDEGTSVKPIARTRDWPDIFPVKSEPDEGWLGTLNKALKEAGKTHVRVALRLDVDSPEDPDDGPGRQYVIVRNLPPRKEAGPAAWPALDGHLAGVQAFADEIAKHLRLEPGLAKVVSLAAAWHDLGKGRAVWQRGAGNTPAQSPVAKPIHGRPPENLNRFRHELGSMLDAVALPPFASEWRALEPDQRELLLHLIAAHHGRGRPHFPPAEAFDPERPDALATAVAGEVPGRFARLQATYGRWGLAYLESLLRAADALDSRRIEEASVADAVPGTWLGKPPTLRPYTSAPTPRPSITVAVDPTNPGQFFACCGLLELATRIRPEAEVEGWFTDNDRQFQIAIDGSLADLVRAISEAKVELVDEDDIYSGRVRVGIGTRPLVLDWWHEHGGRKDAKDLKVWAGTMESHGIAHAMQRAMRGDAFLSPELFNVGMVVSDADDRKKKKEPYYFDARRAPNAHSRDVGFSANDLGLTTTAFPAVEFLCLVGLQRCLPARNGDTRIYDYFTWSVPLPPPLLPAAVPGLLPYVGARGYRFENWFRTGQRKHKAFRSAIPLTPGGAR